jgi:hypothetical protein
MVLHILLRILTARVLVVYFSAGQKYDMKNFILKIFKYGWI